MTSYLWKLLSDAPVENVEQLIDLLLGNRGISSNKEPFFSPRLPEPLLFGQEKISRFKDLVFSAVRDNLPIIIHGDYDVDGICGTALLWEAIYFGLNYKNVIPFIPDRFDDGYGLSTDSLEKITSKYKRGLLITNDCGIASISQVEKAKKLGFNVVITDHHQQAKQLPSADLVVWTDQLCGAGIAWLLSQSLEVMDGFWGLDLACLATIADVAMLVGMNRALVWHGLNALSATTRPGLQALFQLCELKAPLSVYDVGWIIAPRLNACGRMEGAYDALRLLCTRHTGQAQELARYLDLLNRERQELTKKMFEHAKGQVASPKERRIIVVGHETYHEGVIGLVAGKLVREFYRPSFVVACDNSGLAKGSARSISAFDVARALSQLSDILEGYGGHPMAAGFSLRKENIKVLSDRLEELGQKGLREQDLVPILNIDACVPFSLLDWGLLKALGKLEPFGQGNPEPNFLVRGLKVVDIKLIGSHNDHLKLKLSDSEEASFNIVDAVGFGLGSLYGQIHPGCLVDAVFNLQENVWQGNKALQLKISDLKLASADSLCTFAEYHGLARG